MQSHPSRRPFGEVHSAAEELTLLYDTAPVGLCVIDASGRFLRINRRLAEINGVPAEAHIGRTIRDVVPGLAEAAEALLRRVVETGQPVLEVEVEGETPAQPGMRRIWLEDWSPLHDPAGHVVAVNVVAREVTEERAVARALRESEARLATVLDMLPVGVGLIDMAGRLAIANREMRRFVPEKIPSQDPGRRDRWFAWNPDGTRIAARDYPGMRALRGETVLPGIEFRHVLDDGAEVWTRVAAVPLRDERGVVTGAVTVVSDITEAKATEENQTLLLQELNHRARNILAVVRAALQLTPRDDAAAYARSVQGRVDALARAQTLLIEGQWAGAALRPIFEAELAAFLPSGLPPGAPPGAAAPGGVALQGPDLRLTPAATQALSMTVHELATNSVKHGALGCRGGRLEVGWEVDRGASLLRIRWAEHGGPPLSGPPARSGFGARVIAATVTGQLGGTVDRAWTPDGLVCDLAIPLDRACSGGVG
jgi:PAS domain S-box-containing protein